MNAKSSSLASFEGLENLETIGGNFKVIAGSYSSLESLSSFKEDKDILGIAISGQGTSKFPLVVSYFIKFSTDDPSVLDVDNSLLGLENLKKVYQKKKAERFSGSISNLTKTLSALNSQFQKENIVRDTERSLFFSGLMIALKDNTFRACLETSAFIVTRRHVDKKRLCAAAKTREDCQTVPQRSDGQRMGACTSSPAPCFRRRSEAQNRPA